MKTLRLSFLLLTILLCAFNFSQTAGQTKPDKMPPTTRKSNEISIDRKTNSKYKLSFLFGTDDKAEANFVKIRSDENGKEFVFYNLVETPGAISWSPDGEHLAVNNAYGINIYKTADLVKSFADATVREDNFFDKTKTADEISVLDERKSPAFRHNFLNWKNSSSFVFEITYLEWNETTKNNPVGEFSYDFVKKQLSRRMPRNESTLSPDKQKIYSPSARFSGKNKNKNISRNNIKNEIDRINAAFIKNDD